MSLILKLKAQRLFSALLAVFLMFGLTAPALALGSTGNLGRYSVVAAEQHTVAPGVTETKLILNTKSGQEQNCGYLMEVNTAEPSVSLKVNYKDGDVSNWGVRQGAFQAAQVEARLRQTNPNATVVGLVNANYFDMSNGAPCGIVILDGVKYHGTDTPWSYLAIFRDGSARIMPGGSSPPEGVVDAIAGKEMLVKDGKIVSQADKSAEPRTAIGVRADGTVVLFAVDGRQAPTSQGMKFSELAGVMRDLGCVDAANFDGGGSTLFMTRRPSDNVLLRRNSPSGGMDRPLAGTVMVVSSAPHGGTDPTPVMAHSWIFTPGNSTISCADCNETRDVSDFTGFAAINGTKETICFIAGTPQTGWFAWGDSMQHADEDGKLHQTETDPGRDCLSGGYLSAYCDSCTDAYKSAVSRPRAGHLWDQNHVCLNCGKQGKDIAAATVSGLYEAYAYESGSGIKPNPVLKYNGSSLAVSASTGARDGYVSWENFSKIGTARVIIHGQGDYYGLLIKTYRIVPDIVRNVRYENMTGTSVDLSWSAVDGAEQYAVFRRTGDSMEQIAVTNGKETSIHIEGLDKQTDYTLCVKARATADGKQYDSENWSWIYPRIPGTSEQPTDVTLPFTDVAKNSYYYSAVAWAYQKGITDGTGAATFSPGKTCTRGQIVTFLWRTVGCPEPKSLQHGFKDVKAGSYYEKAVAWAVEEGITDGTSATTFSPDASCLRAHAVTFLFRLTKAAPIGGSTPFRDVPSDAYYHDAVTWAYRSGVVDGMTDTTFGPNVKCQRDHIVTILYRYFG